MKIRKHKNGRPYFLVMQELRTKNSSLILTSKEKDNLCESFFNKIKDEGCNNEQVQLLVWAYVEALHTYEESLLDKIDNC